jgi:hypothetical protein
MICARPTERYPQGRTGTTAGYQAHRRRKESTCADCRRAHAAEVRTRQQRPDYKSRRRAEYERNWDSYAARNLKAKHGLTVDQYAEKLKDQDGGCAICEAKLPGGKSKGRFFVDHNHDCCPSYMSCPRCQRGLLCAACNVGLGAFGDDVDRLMAAAAYLMSWRESPVPLR